MLLCEQVNARPRSMIYVHDSQPKRGKSRRFSNEHSSLSPLFPLSRQTGACGRTLLRVWPLSAPRGFSREAICHL